MSDDDDSNVVQFADFRNSALRPRAEPKRGGIITGCSHANVWVLDDETKRVECRHCGAFIDPHAVLLRFATRDWQFMHTMKSLHAEKKRLEAEIDDLKRQKSNLSAQIRRRKP